MIEVLKFSAIWCGPCKQLAPKFKDISEKSEYKDIEFKEIDIDKNQDLATQYNIRSIPTVIVIENNSVVKRIVGYAPEKIEQALNEIINQK